MFNGIIKNTGKIKQIHKSNKSCFIEILSNVKFLKNEIGTSVSCSGACLTLEKAISFLSKEEKHRTFKKVLIDIESSVKKGLLLSDALGRHQGVFNNLYIFC